MVCGIVLFIILLLIYPTTLNFRKYNITTSQDRHSWDLLSIWTVNGLIKLFQDLS